jgi:hypothetical protein
VKQRTYPRPALPVDFNLFGAGIFRQGIGRRGLTAIADGVEKYESLTRQNYPISHLYSVSTKSTLLIQTTHHSRRRVIHGIASPPGDLVRIVSSNLQPTIPDSAGPHLKHAPRRETHTSRNPTGRTLVRIVRLVRVFSGRPLSRIPRLSRIFSGQAFHGSPTALSTPSRPTAKTFSSFSALYFAQTPSSGDSARTSLDSAKNRPDMSTFRKQRAWRPRQRAIHSVASLPADLVCLVCLIRTFLQRTMPDSAPGCHPEQAFHSSPAALSTRPGEQQGLFALFVLFSHFYAPGPCRAGTPPERAKTPQKISRV